MRRGAVGVSKVRLALGLVLLATPAGAQETPAPRADAQDTLRLPALQEAAVGRDPRLRQLELEASATELRLRNLAVERLPGFRLTGEATLQSEVAEIPLDIPSIRIPTPPRDRYEVALNADWLLLDGGVVGARRAMERAQLVARRAELAAALYPLRLEVADAFFGALVLQERLRELTTLIADLEASLSEARDRVLAGAALAGDTAAVRAEMLRAVQQRGELAADRRAALAVLSELTGHAIAATDVLALPDLDAEVARAAAMTALLGAEPGSVAAARLHPQYAVFDAQRERLERERALIRARSMPQLSAFGEYAYGRPGFQQFTREFHDYWLGGVRFHWAPWDWGTRDREAATVGIRQRIVDTEEASFTARLMRQVQEPLESMRQLREAIAIDEQIIVLREQVERQARAQFGERSITAAAYVDARTDLQEARLGLLRHRAELVRAQAQFLTTLGFDLPDSNLP